jgi:Secretion system C-terminal sorting domain
MKRISTIIAFMVFWGAAARAQVCDVAQRGVAIYDASNTSQVASVPVGQVANFKFSVTNLGTDPNCSIPANSITAVFDFPTMSGNVKPYIYDGPPVFVSGYFTWTYNADAEVLMGTNTMAVPYGAGDNGILVRIKGNASGSGNSNLNLTQGMGISDNASNNFSGARMIVSAASPLPVDISSFTVTTEKCDAVLKWKTESESRFSHFEVEYSPDGTGYIKITTIQGKNSISGAEYGFTYTQLNGMGYYRLRMVDINGNAGYSKAVRVTATCQNKGRVLVYPNPINYDQKLVVNISGYTGSITGELFNATGQKVSAYNLANRSNEISVMNVSAGVYMLYIRTTGSDEKVSFKVVVTR